MQAPQPPNRKINSGGLAGAVSILVVYGLKHLGWDVPGEVGGAIGVISFFIVSYFVPEPE